MSAAERLKYYTPSLSVAYPNRYTVAEYLAIAAATDARLEYTNGCIVENEAGGSFRHALIAANALTALNIALKGAPCKAIGSDLKVATEVSFRFPDALIVCREPEFYDKNQTILTNPTVLMEVVSSESSVRDYVTKRLEYFSIPSLRHYIVIEQEVPTVSVYTKNQNATLSFVDYDFKSNIIRLDGIIDTLNIVINMNDIYEGVHSN